VYDDESNRNQTGESSDALFGEIPVENNFSESSSVNVAVGQRRNNHTHIPCLNFENYEKLAE